MRKEWQWIVLAGLVAGAAAAVAAPGPLPPPEDQDLARAIFQELVAIRTTHDQGSTRAARAIQQHLLHASFPESDVVFIAPPEHPSKGNVVVRYRGKGRGKPVLFLGHLDVVEAQAQDWSVDPFQLTEKDG
jgi:acetylornithine deacetylase/succinyl-diaminopimelate desuccinylase-like protein